MTKDSVESFLFLFHSHFLSPLDEHYELNIMNRLE